MRNSRFSEFFTALLLTTVGLNHAGLAQQSKPAPLVHEELIAEVSGQNKVVRVGSSIAGDNVFWVEERPNHKQMLLLNGKQIGEEYDHVEHIVTSRDGRQTAFTARRESHWVLVVNGKDAASEYEDILSPSITASGRFVAAGRKDKKWRIITDRAEIVTQYQEISNPGFDDAGMHYSRVARRNGKWITLLDGKELGVEMDTPEAFDWSHQHVSGAAQVHGKWTWLVDGEPGPGFDVIGGIRFTPDGKHYAYGGADGSPGQPVVGSIVVDGKVVASNAGLLLRGGWFNNQRLYRGLSRLEPSLYGVSDPTMAADGSVFYAMRRENGVAVSFQGAVGPGFEGIPSEIEITPDARHVAYVGKRGDSFIEVRDQALGPSFTGKGAGSIVAWIMLSRDGSHLAYEIMRSSRSSAAEEEPTLRRLVVDGKDRPEFEALGFSSFQFSDDGKHYLYFIHSPREQLYRDRLILDGRELSDYDNVLAGTRFIGPHTVQFIAQQRKRFLKVTQELE